MTRARNSANLASHGNLFVDITNDRTGIGSVVPGQSLHVAGTAGFHADTTFTGDLYNATWDRSDNSLKFVDNAVIKMGNNNDLSFSHDGTASRIQDSYGALFIGSNLIELKTANLGEIYLNCTANGSVSLRHNNVTKFETTAYGTNTTGTAVNDGLVVAGVATVTTMNVTGVLTYDDVTSVDSVGIVTARQGFRATGGTTLLGATSAGFTPHTSSWATNSALRLLGNYGGGLSFSDNGNNGYSVYVDTSGQNFYIKNGAVGGSLKNSIKCVKDGSVELYHNDTLKFSTQNHGATLQGNLNINGTVNANVRLQSGPNTVYASVTFFNAAGSASNSINSYAASILFITGRDATVFSDSSAEICEIVSSGIHPRTASTACALGTSSKRWDNVYADAVDIAGRIIGSNNASTVPTAKFTNSGTGNQLELYGSTTSTLLIKATNNNGTPKLQLRDNYNRDNFISVTDSGDNLVLAVDEGNQGADSTMQFRVDGSEKLRITSDGQTIVNGTTNLGHPNMDDIIVGDASGNRGITIASGSGTNFGSVAFGDSTDGSGADRYEGLIEYFHGDDSLSFYTAHINKLKITSGGNIGLTVADPKSKLHLPVNEDVRIGGQYGGTAQVQNEVAYSSGYTGVHWMFESNQSVSWCFDGVMIVNGSGSSSYGSEVVKITIVYSREHGALNSGDTHRNGSSSYNIETLGHDQVGLNPSAGSFSVTEQTDPDGAGSTRSLFKLSWSASGQSVGVDSMLLGNIHWGAAASSGSVEIQDKDGNVKWNSNP